MAKLEIDSDNGEIRVDGYEYVSTKVNVKTYGISAEFNNAPKSANVRLTGSDNSTDNVAFVGGTNVTIVRTDENTITFSAAGIDTNTKYSISSETSQIGNAADIRLTDSDGYIDNVTIAGGANISIVRNDENKLTISSAYTSFNSITDGYLTAQADQPNDTFTLSSGAGISIAVNSNADSATFTNTGVTQFNNLTGNVSYNSFGTMSDGNNTAIADQPNDTFLFLPGTGIGVLVNSANDNITISNTGVTSLNGGTGAQYQYATISDGSATTSSSAGNTTLSVIGSNGLKSTVTANTVTVAMSQTTLPRASDLTINNGATLAVLATNVVPQNTTLEISGVILFSFSNGAAANTFDIILATGSGNIGANTSKVAVGFTCHAGDAATFIIESSKADPTSTIGQPVGNTNIHAIRFSGIFQTDAVTANSLIIFMKNNCANPGETLIAYAKSFIRYNVI